MTDVYCRLCGEPWDSYGARHGEMTPSEYQRLMRGEGCPACGFGTICPSCGGSGRERGWGDCPTCDGMRVLFPWRAPEASRREYRGWVIGYHPNIRACPVRADDITVTGRHMSADGPVDEGRAICPDCHDTAPECTRCGGDGKLHRENADALDKQWLWGLMEGTDEDPLQFL